MANIIVFGNGEAPIKSINFLKNNGHKLLIVVDDKDRGVDAWQKSLLKYCRKNNLDYLSPKKLKEKKFIDTLRSFEPEIIFSIQCRKIIEKEIIDLVNGEIFNFHFSDLPKNRGVYPGFWHILNGDEHIGVTLHKLTEGIDDGPVISKKKKKILISDTTKSVYFWCLGQALLLLKVNIEKLISKNYKSIPQDISKVSYYSRNSVNFEENYVNWNQEAFRATRFIQAFTFPPFQLSKTRFRKLTLEIEKVINQEEKTISAIPGTIIEVKNNNYAVQTKVGTCTISLVNKKIKLDVNDKFYF